MPLRDDLLNPIAGDNPGGENLRYAPVYDKIKEARREDDDAPQGEWQIERKVADFPLVIKLASEALAAKSKDLQLGAWLTEAALRREGFAGLHQGLQLLHSLVEKFWDNLYPEVEDGDLELRAAPLEWVGTRLEGAVRNVPLTRGGYGFFKYKEARDIGTEEDAAANDAKRAKREAGIADGKITWEDWDKSFSSTPTAQYEAWEADLDSCLESLEALNDLCNGKFGNVAPSFNKLHDALVEVRHTAHSLLQKKYDQEGRGGPAAQEEVEQPAEETWQSEGQPSGAATAPARRRGAISLEPSAPEEIAPRLAAVAKFLRSQDANSPAPYLLLRGFRWGELRGYGESPDPTMLIPPSTDVRQSVKRLSLEENWAELLEVAETAMAEPCGRAWLDLQRYVVKACDSSGYYAIATAIRAELRALIADLPGLPDWSLMDDTATANGETKAWLQEFAYPQPAQEQGPSEPASEQYASPMMESEEAQAAPGEPAPPDVFELAMNAARSGRFDEGLGILTHEIAHQQSGRGRFQRRLQLAQLCMVTGHEALAQPILQDIAEDIDRHRLDLWESPDVVAHPLAMLYRCVDKLHGDPAEKQKLYARIARLDPTQALSCLR